MCGARIASRAAGATTRDGCAFGRPSRKPCTQQMPMSRTTIRSLSFSMPSAISFAPLACAKCCIAFTASELERVAGDVVDEEAVDLHDIRMQAQPQFMLAFAVP